jgi:hypothetical protein
VRYQLAALLIGVVTVLALASAASYVWLSVGDGDEERTQIAAEAEMDAVQAALRTRIESLQAQASALLAEQDVTTYAVSGQERPAILDQGRITRGGADYLLVSGPGRSLVWESGLTGSIVNGVEDVAEESVYLLDGAVDGGIFDFVDGPLLAAGAATNPGLDRATIALGVLLDQQTLSTMVSDPSRQLTLAWADSDPPPPGAQVLPGTTP